MKKILLNVLTMVALTTLVGAQNIIDADDSRNPNDFYQQGLVVGKKAMPYPYLRESDVVWRTTIWRNIDFNEAFNQFFYFPTDMEKSTQGRINLVNLIVEATKNGQFPVYEDDDMKVPMDTEKALENLNGRKLHSEPVYDPELDDDVLVTDTSASSFEANTAKLVQLKEFWYIDKQDTRQKVRITGLSFKFEKDVIRGEGTVTMADNSFWIPMDYLAVRNVLVNANAYEATNDVAERSYDDVFIQRYFDSYITRQSNTYNRSIDQYLTGEDAILESQRIENDIFDIESDMWEY